MELSDDHLINPSKGHEGCGCGYGGAPEAIHIKEVSVPALPSNHVLIALEYVGVGIRRVRRCPGHSQQ